MIKITPEQLEKCKLIFNNADSVYDAQDDILDYLQIIPTEDNLNDISQLWSTILRNPVSGSDASIEAPKPHNVRRMYELAEQLASTYERKNHDYGNSFSTSVTKYGIIAALTRMSDKWNRLENLILNKDAKVKDEAITDTLIDLAAYALMTVMEVEK